MDTCRAILVDPDGQDDASISESDQTIMFPSGKVLQLVINIPNQGRAQPGNTRTGQQVTCQTFSIGPNKDMSLTIKPQPSLSTQERSAGEHSFYKAMCDYSPLVV